MSRDNDTHFGRGETAYMGSTPNASALLFEEILGSAKVFEDVAWGTFGAKQVLSAHLVECLCVRNISGGLLTPNTVVELGPTLTTADNATDAAETPAFLLGVVDPYLPTAGVADDDVFWVVRKGPTVVKVDAGTAISAGAALVCTAAGKLDDVDAAPATGTAALKSALAVCGYLAVAAAKDDTTARAFLNCGF